MQLQKIIDPRDNLEKLRRTELYRLAKSEGLSDIEPGMPAILMRRMLRDRGIRDVPDPNRPLGGVSNIEHLQKEIEEEPVRADDLLKSAYETDKLAQMPFFALRRLCKDRGIAFSRTDKKPVLIGKLNGENTP